MINIFPHTHCTSHSFYSSTDAHTHILFFLFVFTVTPGTYIYCSNSWNPTNPKKTENEYDSVEENMICLFA